MTRLSRIGVVAAAAIAAAASCGWLGWRHGAVQQAETVALVKPALGSWYERFQRDAAALELRRHEVKRAAREAAVELARMQARLVRVNALGRRLVDRFEALDSGAFDFARDPALGGPQSRLPGVDDSLSGDGRLSAGVRALSSRIADRRLQLNVLDELLRRRELSEAVRPDGRPVAGAYVSSGFGPRTDPFTGKRASHSGVDFAARADSPVLAVAAGIVIRSDWRAGYGRTIDIYHGNGHVTRYAHNRRNLATVGDVVSRGQTIARVGSSGRATGPNLHFELLEDGRAVDPIPFIGRDETTARSPR